MIFIDTGGFIARYIEKDQYHKKASLFWEKIGKRNERMYTSNFILNETFTLLARWAGTEFSINTAHTLYASDVLRIIRPEQDDEIKALHYMKKLGKSKSPVRNLAILYLVSTSFFCLSSGKAEEIFPDDPVNPVEINSLCPWRPL